MIQKKNVQQLKDHLHKTIPKTENKLKGPKRFCTNCIANLFREQNGVYSIYESLKDEDEQASLEPKKKLEIIKGLHLLIQKENASNSNMNKHKDNVHMKDEQNVYYTQNIFNDILGNGSGSGDNQQQHVNETQVQQEQMTQGYNWFIGKTNMCQNCLSKINDYANETNMVLYLMQNKLVEYFYQENAGNVVNDIQHLRDVLNNKSILLNKAINEYDFILHSLNK
jgi:hypothetical protein